MLPYPLPTFTMICGPQYQAKLYGCAGEVLSQWGGGEFFLPHMITVDKEGDVWTTDVALHVATKWSSAGTKLLELGHRLVPGHDKEHLCKPTQVSCAAILADAASCSVPAAQGCQRPRHDFTARRG